MTTENKQIDLVLQETGEALMSAGRSLLDLTAVTTVATAHTIELTTRAAVVTIDTVDYGLKVTLKVMPKNGAEAVALGASLLAAAKEDTGNTEDTTQSQAA